MLWLMVAVAVSQQLAKPDLGCDKYSSEADCLIMKSPFDPEQPACAWDPALEDACALAPPDASTMFTPLNMILLVLGMLVINPILLLIEWFYLSVFNAPRPKPCAGLAAERTREQQRWVYSPGQVAEAAAGEAGAKSTKERPERPVLPAGADQCADCVELEAGAECTELAGSANIPHDHLLEPSPGELAVMATCPFSLGVGGLVCYDPDEDGAVVASPQDDSHVQARSASLGSILYGDPDDGMSSRRVRQLLAFVDGTPGDDEVAPGPEAELEGGEDEDEALLPDPNDGAEFDAFIEMISARECLAVVARRAELAQAVEYLRSTNDARGLRTVREILSAFEQRWGFAPRRCASYYLLGGSESEEERLKVRLAWQRATQVEISPARHV